MVMMLVPPVARRMPQEETKGDDVAQAGWLPSADHAPYAISCLRGHQSGDPGGIVNHANRSKRRPINGIPKEKRKKWAPLVALFIRSCDIIDLHPFVRR
jgi:hypothetical protein